MSRALAFFLLTALSACRAAAPEQAPTQSDSSEHSTAGAFTVREIARGLEHPWSVALLPGGGFLVTERPGRLRHIDAQGNVSALIAGVPKVWAEGQGGLLDVALAPDFARSGVIYLSYAAPGPDGTAVSSVMPFSALKELNETDMKAAHLYLRSLPPRAAGGR